MLVVGHDALVAAWAKERLGAAFFSPFTAIGIAEAGADQFVGAIVVHDWNGSNVEMTAILDRALTRRELRGLHDYVFRRLGARRITLRTRTDNRPAVLFLRRHALFEANLKNWFETGDAMQFVIHRDDARWSRWRSA